MKKMWHRIFVSEKIIFETFMSNIMRIIFTSIFTALLLCPAPDVAHAQHELQFGMQAIRMNSGAAKILSQAENVKKKSQQTAAPVKTHKDTSQMDAIWQKYKAIDKGQLTSQVAAPQKTIGKKTAKSMELKSIICLT